MPWLRIDDHMADHPKVGRLSDAAFAGHVRGLCYCARYLTNGRIPKHVAARMFASAAALRELLSGKPNGPMDQRPLWYDRGTHYEVHDYLAWNPTRERAAEVAEQKAEAGRRGGETTARRRKTKPADEPRARDEVWDALALLLGEPTNDLARGRRNKAAKLLRQSGATPGEIQRRAAEYQKRWTTELTDMALASRWDDLGRPTLAGIGPTRSGPAAARVDDQVDELIAFADAISAQTTTVVESVLVERPQIGGAA